MGHEISGDGVRTDHKNVVAVAKWPTPTTVKEVRGFLGLAGYYRKFVRNFGITSRPLTDLLKKNTVFRWTELEETAFQELKRALITAPVLALPDFKVQFELETDASDKGIGAVLKQGKHPVAFLSKALGPRNSALSTYEKEGLAILLAVEHWRQYLQNDEFLIHTDQRSLVHLEDQRLATPWQQKIMSKLLGMRYRIVYKRGVDNRVADALSRRPGPPQGDLASITVTVPAWLDSVQQGYNEDPMAQRWLARLATGATNKDGFTLDSGIIKQHGRVWLGNNVTVQKQVLSALHASAIGGHSGFNVTYKRVRRLFTWPGMKQHVRLFVEDCQICKQAKPERVRYPGLLEPLPVPTQAWEVITMDFVEGLPQSARYNSILVVVDKFSRLAHFIPLSHPFTAFQVAQTFVNNIYKLHGLPAAIVSDRDPIFTSIMWKELFCLTHTELRMSTARHPQTDGQTERVNQCLETYLRCFVHACPTKWSQWLPLAEFWYNTSPHSALGTSPFEALYGHAPRFFGIDDPLSCAAPDLEDWLQDRAQMEALLHQHLLQARQQMKDSADKKRSVRVFAVDDWAGHES